jgi:hypothetical protein
MIARGNPEEIGVWSHENVPILNSHATWITLMHLLHRAELGSFLNQAGLTGAGVEVGVAEGIYSRQILRSWAGRRLTLVDCWQTQDSSEYCDEANTDIQIQETRRRAVEALAQADPRAQLLQAFTPQAAARFADESLDFVYLDANHSYPAVRADLRAWYPKLKVGGILAGHDYMDGYFGFGPDLLGGTLFGVQSAVDEFARALGQAVAFTTTDPPFSWYLRKRAPRWPERITVLTAYDQSLAAQGAWSRPNKEAYCLRHGYTFRCRTDGFDPARPPAWSKIRFLLDQLPDCDWVFWTDADSLVMNSAVPLSWFVDDHYDLILSRDRYNGLNTGNFLVRNTPWTRAFLERVYQQEQFISHPLWENAAVLALYAADAEVRQRVNVVPNKLFNGYITDGSYAPGDFIVHFAGLKDREVFLKNYAPQAR